MATHIGDRLGSYEIVSALGAGGMGEVYRALDTKLKRQVAIKIPAHQTDDWAQIGVVTCRCSRRAGHRR